MSEHPDHRAAMGARTLIAHLQESVQAWIDSDRVLPADGASLLALLDRAPDALAAGFAPAARAGILAFAHGVTALIAAGVLTAGDGQPALEMAAALLAQVASAGGADP